MPDEIGPGTIITVVGAITGVMTGSVAVIAALQKHWRDMVRRLERQLVLHDQHAEEQDAAYEEIQDRLTDLLVKFAELWGYAVALHKDADRIARECGKEPGVVPALPDKPELREHRARAEFMKRTNRQTTGQLKAVDERITNPPEGGS